jgi:hypothetical protein
MFISRVTSFCFAFIIQIWKLAVDMLYKQLCEKVTQWLEGVCEYIE